MTMLGSSAVHAIRALLELAEAPQRWRSVHALAVAQDLPEPLLEQLMLRLRRAGILEARRGRQGGYRLAKAAAALPISAILNALAGESPPPRIKLNRSASDDASDRVTGALEHRLQQAIERELTQCSLEDLLHDLRSARASLSEEGGLQLG